MVPVFRNFRFQDCLMLNPKMTQFDIIDVWFCSYAVATDTFVCFKRYVFSMIRFFEDMVLKLPLPTARPIMTHGRNIWTTIPRSGTLHLESLEHIGALYRVQNLSVSFHNCAVFFIGLVLDQAIPQIYTPIRPKGKGSWISTIHSQGNHPAIHFWRTFGTFGGLESQAEFEGSDQCHRFPISFERFRTSRVREPRCFQTVWFFV